MRYDYNNFPPTGIDLGTSNSVIAVYEKKNSSARARAISLTCNSPAGPLLASAVMLEEDEEDGDQLIVGSVAVNNRISKPDMFASAFKRKIGSNEKNIKIGKRFFSAIDLSKEVIKKLLYEKILQDLEFDPPGIVVSIPYNYTHVQKKNTKLATELAIEEVFSKIKKSKQPKFLGLLPEPVAAAINYTFNNQHTNFNNHAILIFDFGGGTLDITICKLSIKPTEIRFEVLATDGSEKFGGEDIDYIIEKYLRENYKEEFDNSKLDERISRMLDQQIRDIAKTCKEDLSVVKKAPLVAVLKNGKTIDSQLTRKDFELLLKGGNFLKRDFGQELQDILNRIFKNAKISGSSIQKAILVGGSSQIPYFKKILESKCSAAEFLINSETIETGVAKGAAIYASYLLDRDFGADHGAFREKLSYGKLIFRTPSSIGVRINGGEMETIIPANTIVPAKKNKIFYFKGYADYQKQRIATKKIEVYQGEASLVDRNTKIGVIELPAIHTHGRELKNMPIKILFKADENFVDVEILVSKGSVEGKDIHLKNRLKL